MDRLNAAWRSNYINAPKHDGCIFCDFPKENKDDEHFIVYRGRLCFVIMNLYPYNGGHLMVIPYRHTNLYESLTDEEALELHKLSSTAIKALKKIMHPDGFNMGMNLGQVAGAGVAGHLHRHIVPRWNGDNNFMPVLGETRVLSDSISNTWRKLKEVWDECL